MNRRAAVLIIGLAMAGWMVSTSVKAATPPQQDKTVTLQVTGMM